jgi:hypothetical protein
VLCLVTKVVSFQFVLILICLLIFALWFICSWSVCDYRCVGLILLIIVLLAFLLCSFVVAIVRFVDRKKNLIACADSFSQIIEIFLVIVVFCVHYTLTSLHLSFIFFSFSSRPLCTRVFYFSVSISCSIIFTFHFYCTFISLVLSSR